MKVLIKDEFGITYTVLVESIEEARAIVLDYLEHLDETPLMEITIQF